MINQFDKNYFDFHQKLYNQYFFQVNKNYNLKLEQVKVDYILLLNDLILYILIIIMKKKIKMNHLYIMHFLNMR